ncbi:LysR family transcriptional regulator [Pseudoduganella namucuonensis]|uniref:LysR family transcriptional regulator, regulator for bpeEF and oprC n=1 Tax=Pseudoduganella namucuonensis TaxID=1035707 RepID=A0A1I7GV05_9BURK|nr:LysR family transcriptional regulator [Pseudoduganella namucuonensis]SFU52284.1 LysR family transcriptional regulator, regulator for bpeEF and oprC [Pseudoduganella namucuonensis]
MNKLQAMEVFVQVVDAGGFTRAADNMKLPKATVSNLIQGLETALAVKLLHRTTRQISVTADGAAYYERCLRILSDVREAEESLSRTKLSPSGRLRVDAPTGLARQMLIPALPDFFERYPDITLELGCSDRPVDLIEENVDCAVRGGELGDSALIARRIGVLGFVTCAAPDYIARYGTPLHPRELERHRCINYFSSKTGKVYDWDFSRDGERIQLPLPGLIALNDSDAYVTAGLAGLGVVQMTDFALTDYLRDGQLVQLLADWTSDPVPIHVVYPQNRHLSAKVRVFVEWVSDLFAKHPGMRGAPPTTSTG